MIKLSYNLFFGTLLVGLIITLIFLVCRKNPGESKLGGFTYVIIGMLIGGSSGILFFFNIDTSKGWNPYGWWFLATFVLTIIGGFLGLFIFGSMSKKRDNGNVVVRKN